MRSTTVGDTVAHRPTRRHGHAWPFMAQPDPAKVSDFGVGVPRRQEVVFNDGTRVWLHRVEHQGVPDLFLRDLGAPGEGTRIDLRTLVPELAMDLPSASTRDVPGIVHFSLRGRFQSVGQLIDAAVATGRPA